jgi:hypothetical protein
MTSKSSQSQHSGQDPRQSLGSAVLCPLKRERMKKKQVLTFNFEKCNINATLEKRGEKIEICKADAKPLAFSQKDSNAKKESFCCTEP